MAADPVLYYFPQLEGVFMTSLQTKLTVAAGTCLFFLLLFLLSFLLSYLFVDSFTRRLRAKEKVFWCLAFVRAAFGFGASAVGIWYLFFDDLLRKDVVHANNVTTFVTVYVTVGFFTFECVALFSSNIYFRFFDKFLFAHHFLSLVGYCIATACDGKGHFFAVVGLLLEMTTPFSCFCWMLLKCDMAHLRIWKINQLVLVHLFHCRTTLEAYFYYMYFSQWDNVKEGMPLPISVTMLVQLTANFFLLTPYWTYKKMTQLFNPVDWNHPELAKTTATNGSSAAGGSTRTKSKKHVKNE